MGARISNELLLAALSSGFLTQRLPVTLKPVHGNPCRSSMRRLLEVMALVFVTASIWFFVAWASPCRPLPGDVRSAICVMSYLAKLPLFQTALSLVMVDCHTDSQACPEEGCGVNIPLRLQNKVPYKCQKGYNLCQEDMHVVRLLLVKEYYRYIRWEHKLFHARNIL